jgi:Alginate export
MWVFGTIRREKVICDPLSTTYDLHRLLLNGDLHIGDSFRTFIQFGNHLVSSKSLSPPTDVDRFDLQQGFADLKAPLGQNVSMTFRGGRQEILLGSERLVGVREGPNIRMSFDGGRVFYESPDLRLDAFGVVPVVPERGVFDDRGDARQAFPGKVLWGVYGVMPVKAVPGLHLDLYYLGLARKNAPFNSVVASHGRDGAFTVHQDVELLNRSARHWYTSARTVRSLPSGYELAGLHPNAS